MDELTNHVRNAHSQEGQSMTWSYDHRGEGNPNVKLSENQVAAIRKKAARPRHPYGWMSALARKYKVSPATIGDIVHGRRW